MSRSKKDWVYVDRATCSTGDGVCCRCGKPITEGRYRYYETDEAYVNQHRHCAAPDDAGWAKDDAERAAHAKHQAEFQQACDAFFAKWGVTDISDWVRP